MAILIKTDNSIEEIRPKNKKYFSYEELKGFVGGMVEIVPLQNMRSIIVNEEGKLIGLEKNEIATMLWKKEYPIEKYPNNNDELIVGNALIISEEKKELEE